MTNTLMPTRSSRTEVKHSRRRRRRAAVTAAVLLAAVLGATGLERVGLVHTGVLLRLPLLGLGHQSADGVIPRGAVVTAADVDAPAVGRLDPALRDALGKASAAASEAGAPLVITSGWRSTALQRDLYIGGVIRHGGPAAAAKWVSTPENSRHTAGTAVDVGPIMSAVWLQDNGSRFGLCRTYENEWWHFELATTAGGACPAPVSDAAAG